MRIDCISQFGNFPRLNADYSNKYDIYSNLLVVTILKAIWKSRCTELHILYTSDCFMGTWEMLPSLSEIHQAKQWTNYQHLPSKHLSDSDLITSCLSTHNGSPHRLQGALPQNPSLCQFMPLKSHLNVTSSQTLLIFFSHSNKDISVLLSISLR